ncbi:hypothetical protein [Methylobacterium oxalidis]|uniref:hypothetical protein n=1 Tax=Methylobacterium oxalidis TaxID=944322 RepID=UPI00331626EB
MEDLQILLCLLLLRLQVGQPLGLSGRGLCDLSSLTLGLCPLFFEAHDLRSRQGESLVGVLDVPLARNDAGLQFRRRAGKRFEAVKIGLDG